MLILDNGHRLHLKLNLIFSGCVRVSVMLELCFFISVALLNPAQLASHDVFIPIDSVALIKDMDGERMKKGAANMQKLVSLLVFFIQG